MKPSAKSANNLFGELNLRLKPANEPPPEDEPSRTLIAGNLGDRVTEEILYELFLQAGPLCGIRMPRDKSSVQQLAFIVFRHPLSVDFALRLMSGIRLYGKELCLTKMTSVGPPRPAPSPVPTHMPNHTPPQQNNYRGNMDRGYQGGRDNFLYQPSPRPLMAPPPPLFAMPKPPFHSPIPPFQPPMFAPHSDPGYSGANDFRRTHVEHASHTDRSRNGSSYQNNQHYQQQSYHRDETPRRPVPYSRPSAHQRGNSWR